MCAIDWAIDWGFQKKARGCENNNRGEREPKKISRINIFWDLLNVQGRGDGNGDGVNSPIMQQLACKRRG